MNVISFPLLLGHNCSASHLHLLTSDLPTGLRWSDNRRKDPRECEPKGVIERRRYCPEFLLNSKDT